MPTVLNTEKMLQNTYQFIEHYSLRIAAESMD